MIQQFATIGGRQYALALQRLLLGQGFRYASPQGPHGWPVHPVVMTKGRKAGVVIAAADGAGVDAFGALFAAVRSSVEKLPTLKRITLVAVGGADAERDAVEFLLRRPKWGFHTKAALFPVWVDVHRRIVRGSGGRRVREPVFLRALDAADLTGEGLPDPYEAFEAQLKALKTHLLERGEAAHFVRSVLARGRPRVTHALIAVNVAVFLFSVGAGKFEAVVGRGALDPVWIAQGQWWRLVSCVFLHANLFHLFVNAYALSILGGDVERFFGSRRFFAIYMLSGLAGSAASLSFTGMRSVGASGAIFGLAGASVAFALAMRREIPAMIYRRWLTRLVPVIVLNLIIGQTVDMIDNNAHMGGLVAGVVFGLALATSVERSERTSVRQKVLMVVAVSALAASLVLSIWATKRRHEAVVTSSARLPARSSAWRIGGHAPPRFSLSDRSIEWISNR